MYFWGEVCTGTFFEKGWDTGVGRYSSVKPNREILIENTLASKAGRKKLPIRISTTHYLAFFSPQK
jgi:hypothetical protein